MTPPRLETRLDAPDALWAALRAAYRTPPRHYHTLGHVAEVLGWFDEVDRDDGWTQRTEVLLACLYHDAVYEAGARDNERRSARLAADAVARWLLERSIDVGRVSALIELTARHGELDVGDVDNEAALFLDCDMAILAAVPVGYARYREQIAREYARLSPEAYAAGRHAFVARLLARPQIYLSARFRARLEGAARANLAAELASLRPA